MRAVATYLPHSAIAALSDFRQSGKRTYELVNWTATGTQTDINTSTTQSLHFGPPDEPADDPVGLEVQQEIAHRFLARAFARMEVRRTIKRTMQQDAVALVEEGAQ